ncbi:MAG: AAA family ATPase [Roseibium sp.]|uniref:AAA family ATPase n=1 Tax=Roseibium sp. TaxID=1936156 RepID=UPI003299AEA5
MQPDWLKSILSGSTADPDLMTRSFPWAARMIGCPHDPIHHAEGDPWTHTMMVAEALERGDGFEALPPERQDLLRLTAWFHDVAKPQTTEIVWEPFLNEDGSPSRSFEDQQRLSAWLSEMEKHQPRQVGWDDAEEEPSHLSLRADGRERVTQHHHAAQGAMMAWRGLIDAGCDAQMARDVFTMTFWHQRPSHMLGNTSNDRKIIQLSVDAGQGNWDDLIRFCEADQRGRMSQNRDQVLEDLALARLLVAEAGENIGADLLNNPWPFANPESRLKYLRGKGGDLPFHASEHAAGSRVIMMSGLPGSGKDTFLEQNFARWPIVSMDKIREEMGVSPTDNQGKVHQETYNQIKALLRTGEAFAVNSTSLTRVMRQKLSGTILDYDGYIEAYSIDVPFSVARQRNSSRENPVPDDVLVKLANKREPILSNEAHELYSVDEHMNLTKMFGHEPDVDVTWSPAPS